MNLIRFVFLFIISIGIGLLVGFYDLELSIVDFIPIVLGLTVLIYLDHIISFFVLYFSRDMARVEKILYKQKHPYYTALLDITRGNYDEAYKKIERLKNWGRQQQMRALLKAALYLERNNLSSAKRETEMIKNPEVRSYNYALIALMEIQWESYRMYKSKLKNKVFLYILEAEEEYKKGNMEKAEQLGNLAIKASKGLQKYLMLTSLERQRIKPNRESYF
ncbi:hypothetical protein [Paenibacillus sp. LHD-38]|uniref:hypothetical protein n=1 Tax=Paenibacillus sp. LHD-38 TaxID=3072143 RepID=UPI00281074D8|nr:hypothetical protein [Paenibacillus sp. LHD-38]MDQ8734234.1 hypothetical protein [Paenibacillus sp. LHD-38]